MKDEFIVLMIIILVAFTILIIRTSVTGVELVVGTLTSLQNATGGYRNTTSNTLNQRKIYIFNKVKGTNSSTEILKNEINNGDISSEDEEEYNGEFEVVRSLPAGISVNKKIEGVETVEYEGKHYVVIKMGECNHGGHSITVKDIVRDGDNVDIYVKKNSPSPGSITTQAFEYPYVAVIFDFKPIVNVIYE